MSVPMTRESGGAGVRIQVASGAFVSFSAQNNNDSGDLTCGIEADGVVINQGHAQGGFAIVTCSGRVP